MEVNDKVVQLACHVSHQFHEDCYNNFVKHFEEQGQPLNCPLCRSPVAKDKVIKKEIKSIEGQEEPGNNLKVEDAFALSNANKIVRASWM